VQCKVDGRYKKLMGVLHGPWRFAVLMGSQATMLRWLYWPGNNFFYSCIN